MSTHNNKFQTYFFSRCWKCDTNFGSSSWRSYVTGSHFGFDSSGLSGSEIAALRAAVANLFLIVITFSQGNWLIKHPGQFSLNSLGIMMTKNPIQWLFYIMSSIVSPIHNRHNVNMTKINFLCNKNYQKDSLLFEASRAF